MQLRLVSFALCPFVQRAVAVLLEKGIDHRVDYIDLANKPAWFLELSPRGKVPLLVADGTPLFESHAICEFLEETHPTPALMPKDPYQRARDRAWFAFAAEDLLSPIGQRLINGKTEADVRAALEQLAKPLDRLESVMVGREYLSGDGVTFGMADIGMSSALRMIDFGRRTQQFDLLTSRPHLDAWARRVLERESVERAAPADFDAQALAFQRRMGSWLADHRLS